MPQTKVARRSRSPPEEPLRLHPRRELGRQLAALTDAEDITGTLNCCSGIPVSLADQVERFIADNDLALSWNTGRSRIGPTTPPACGAIATAIREVMSRDESTTATQ